MARRRGRGRGGPGWLTAVAISARFVKKLMGACASVPQAQPGDVIATKNDYELVRCVKCAAKLWVVTAAALPSLSTVVASGYSCKQRA